MMQIEIKKEVTTDHLVNLFTGVIEGNSSTYWTVGGVNVDENVREKFSNDEISWWWNPEFYDSVEFKSGEAPITVGLTRNEEDEPAEIVEILPVTIQRGIQLAAEHFTRWFNEFIQNDGFDSVAADVIFQCIVLHDEIVQQNTTGYFSKNANKVEWELIYG